MGNEPVLNARQARFLLLVFFGVGSWDLLLCAEVAQWLAQAKMVALANSNIPLQDAVGMMGAL